MNVKAIICGLLATTAFGAGAATVAASESGKKVSADGISTATTVYCRMTHSWWTTGSAAIGVHYWGDGISGTSWPGVRMSPVEGDNGLWSYTIPAKTTGLIFTRISGSDDVADWGAKTGDLTPPSDSNVLYTITSSSAQWAGEGKTVSGSWSKYYEAGYYLVGDANFISDTSSSGDSWNVSGGYKMNPTTGGNQAEAVLTFTKTVQLRAINYTGGNTDWLNGGGSTGTGISTVGDNYQLAPGTYSFYIGGDSKLYIAVGLQLDAYCSDFLSKTGAKCKGDSTNKSELAAVWSIMQTDWGKLSAENQAILVNTDGSESGTDEQKVMARYDHIIKKYSDFDDFMDRKNNDHYTYKSASLTPVINSNDAMTVAIIVIAVSLFATGAFFLIRKKRLAK